MLPILTTQYKSQLATPRYSEDGFLCKPFQLMKTDKSGQ